MSRIGQQHYTCKECGFKWWQLCRDVMSDSGENCLRCDEHTRPDDEGLKTDLSAVMSTIDIFDQICGSHRWVRANNGDNVTGER